MQFLKKWSIYISCCFLLSSCEFKCNIGSTDSGKDKTVKSTIKNEDGILVSNNIQVTAKNITLESATLKTEKGEKISDDNMVSLNEKIYLHLNLDDNWKTIDGKSYIGASERITTDRGAEILYAGDLFSNYDNDGMDSEEAKNILLSAVIRKEEPNTKFYIVDFKVWDKKGSGKITGKYKFYIKQE